MRILYYYSRVGVLVVMSDANRYLVLTKAFAKGFIKGHVLVGVILGVLAYIIIG